jgi:sulfofructosephosphate aldolase
MPERRDLGALARPSGALAMVALDQRESLRTMLAAARGGPIEDAALTGFKIQAAQTLTPHASAVLLDVDYGLKPVLAARAIADGCGLIVAADLLSQRPGGPVEASDVDDAVFADDRTADMADAYKLLVIWRPNGRRPARERILRRFLDGCRTRGRPGIVEGIVRTDGPLGPDEHARLALAAAVELTGVGPDLYKAEVPTLGAAADDAIATAAARLTEAIDCPWVVLSNGVPPERFDDAAVAACRGGASGFLAGRAIWTASLAASDTVEHLAAVAAPRLARLAARVDTVARPWSMALA